jgi:hypothetical protein
MTDMEQHVIVFPHHGLGKGNQESAVFDTAGRYRLLID